MKRSIFAAVIGIGMAAAVSSYGQGNINFNNYYSSTQLTGVTYANGPAVGLGVGPELSATLLFGASTDTQISQLAPVAGSTVALGLGAASAPGAYGTGAGWFDGGTVNVGVGTFAFAIEVTGTYLGHVYTGFSSIAVGATQATAIAPVPFLPTALRDGSFTVSSVPEPTTMALGGLGLAALLVARRKKA